MDPDLQAILLRDNPWLVAESQLDAWLRLRLSVPFYARQAVAEASRRWGEDRAHLVIGPRQAGKSTAIWAYLAARGVPVLYIDCEQALTQAWCRSAPLFLAGLEQIVAAPVPLFFDEVQHLEEAGLFFKGLVDRQIGVPLLVTGSSSYHLGARTRESLAGRATRARLLPFSLAEVCADLKDQPPAVRAHLSAERFERHLVYGGYPEVWLSTRPETLLADLVEAVVLRDASDFFRIGRPEAFRRLLRLAAGQVGSLINVSEWASILGISRDTVNAYLEILTAGHIVVSLPPFVGGRRAELTSRPKVYFVDNGIRNQLLRDFKPLTTRADGGAVLEGWVFTELWKSLPADATVHFWRSTSGAEVDFVATRGAALLGCEVKAAHLRRPTLTRAARSFIAAYQPAHFLVVNTGLTHTTRLGETAVQWITPADLATAASQSLA